MAESKGDQRVDKRPTTIAGKVRGQAITGIRSAEAATTDICE